MGIPPVRIPSEQRQQIAGVNLSARHGRGPQEGIGEVSLVDEDEQAPVSEAVLIPNLDQLSVCRVTRKILPLRDDRPRKDASQEDEDKRSRGQTAIHQGGRP